MNILLITHSYAPDASPRAYRWTAIAEAWADRGFRVDVVTTGRRGDQGHDEQAGVHVHRAGEQLIGRLTGNTGSKIKGALASETNRANVGSGLRRVAKQIYNFTWRKIFWPDYACLWYRPALKEAKRLCRSRQYDAVITVSHPFTGHLVGLSLKKALPDLRWIADMGDPFSVGGTVASNTQLLYRRLNRRTEAAVLTRSNAVSVTVEGCKNLFIDEFAIEPEKCRVVPPLLSLQTEQPDDQPLFEKDGSIDLVYLGVLYPEIRRPNAVLALFAALKPRLKTCRLHFVGDIQGCDPDFARYPELMGTSVFLHKPVARNRVAALLSASDALINIGNDTPHQLPSKLVEYVAGGRPILNFVTTDTDTSAVFLKDYPRALSLTCPNNSPTDDQVAQVMSFLTNPPVLSDTCLDTFIGQFRLEAVTAAYEDLIIDAPARIK